MPRPHLLRPAVQHSQQQLVAAADRAADAAERAVHAAWRDLLAALDRAGPHQRNWMIAYRAALNALAPLAGRIVVAIDGGLRQCATNGHRVARQTLDDVAGRGSKARDVKALTVARQQVVEAEGDPLSDLFPTAPLPQFDIRQLIRIGDVFEPREIVFDALPLERLQAIVHAGNWQARITTLTKLAPPEMLAAQVANGLQQGLTQQQIARQIRPLLQNVQASARRVARTEGVRVGHQVQMAAWEELGDAVIGYQIHSAHRSNSRHWHIDRDKTIYYKRPSPGQKGLDKMPQPPMEAPDPSERPAGTPQVAPNCLCYLTPVLAEQF